MSNIRLMKQVVMLYSGFGDSSKMASLINIGSRLVYQVVYGSVVVYVKIFGFSYNLCGNICHLCYNFCCWWFL